MLKRRTKGLLQDIARPSPLHVGKQMCERVLKRVYVVPEAQIYLFRSYSVTLV